MIVAMARKLLIALWRLITIGEVPEGEMISVNVEGDIHILWVQIWTGGRSRRPSAPPSASSPGSMLASPSSLFAIAAQTPA
jgi:hypothetical protein